jgi:para-aminobenzoate synthetase/4-amino-4-deoxychorismate lyase
VALARESVDSQDIFLFHKTTHRDVYKNAKADFPGCDDVILWNEKAEVTESTIANVVIRKEGRLLTPPVDCGLLAGTFRGHLLKVGEIEESIISVDDLKAADAVYLINSVRKWQRVELE